MEYCRDVRCLLLLNRGVGFMMQNTKDIPHGAAHDRVVKEHVKAMIRKLMAHVPAPGKRQVLT
jgi:hypothetical protein